MLIRVNAKARKSHKKYTKVWQLAVVEKQAHKLFNRLRKQRAEHEGIIEKLKADNQMEWIGRIKALRSAVIETVNAEVIFV